MTKIALADDHLQMRKTIKTVINQISGYSVDIQASNGFELLVQLQYSKNPPPIAVIDIGMPIMDGQAVTHYMRTNYPDISVLAISAYSHSSIVTETFESGAKGYLLKDNISVSAFQKAFDTITEGGIFLDSCLQHIQNYPLKIKKETADKYCLQPIISLKEKAFLQLAATAISYDQIAELLNVGKESIYNYQKSLKEKLCIGTRQEFMLYAIQHGIAKVAKLNNYGYITESLT